MLDVYTQEWTDMDLDGPLDFFEIVLNVRGTDIWIAATIDPVQLETLNHTPVWYDHVRNGKINLTYIGEV